MMVKSPIRYELGNLDVPSALLFLIGIYLTQTPNLKIGWLFIGIAILKQFSGK